MTGNDNAPGQLAIDALLAEARRELRKYSPMARPFNPPVGTEGHLVDLVKRLTDTLMAVHRERPNPYEVA